jgi:type II secretory pathway pseudopilin PulG
MKKRIQRGGAMLITMLVVVGLLLLAAGGLAFSASHGAAGAALRRHQQLASCALAVRQYIGSQLRFPSQPAISTLNFTIPGTGGNILIEGGHYDQPLPSVVDFQIQGSSSTGVAQTVEELASVQRTMPGGRSMTGAAICMDQDKNQYEVEFSFAFGI